MEESAAAKKRRRPKSRMRRVRLATTLALAAVAVTTELRKPKADRTWTGKLAGFVPYDFRRPTVARARQRWWNEHEPRVFVPRVFGVGWTVNFRSAVGKVRHAVGSR